MVEGTLNGGNGGVLSVNGSILGIQRVHEDENIDSPVIGISFMGFASSKQFIKYDNCTKNPQKYYFWEVTLDKKDLDKFIVQFNKMIDKLLVTKVENKEKTIVEDK